MGCCDVGTHSHHNTCRAMSIIDNHDTMIQQVLLKSEVHKDLWKGANRHFRTIPWRKVEMRRHNAERTPEQAKARLQRAVARDRKRMQRLAAAGIEYEYEPMEAPGDCPAAAAAKPAAAQKKAKQDKPEDVVKVVKKAAKAKGRLADVEKDVGKSGKVVQAAGKRAGASLVAAKKKKVRK